MHVYGSASPLEFLLGGAFDPSQCSFPLKELTPRAPPSRVWMKCLKGQVSSCLSRVVALGDGNQL